MVPAYIRTEQIMKKRNLACLALAAPLLSLAACAGGTANLALSANWFLHTGDDPISSANETLEYAVTFEASDENTVLTYGDGTYKSVLSAETVKLADGTTEMCYHVHTELAIPVTYTLNGEQASFDDKVTSDVWFRDVSHSLQPVRSEKYVLSHTPMQNASPDKLDALYETYEYTLAVEYDAACANAKMTLDYAQPSDTEASISEVELSGSGTYLDNEQILFALRGVSMSSASAFRSINPAKRAVETVSMAEAPSSATEKLTFDMNGESKERELTTYTFSLGYGGNNPGMSQTYTYAGVTDANNNLYRSALLRMEVPVLNSMGTLRYTLVKATF